MNNFPVSGGIATEDETAELRIRWMTAATAITRRLLVDDGGDPLALIAGTVRSLAEARSVLVTLPTHDQRHLVVEVAAGADELVGITFAIRDSIAGQAITRGVPVVHPRSAGGMSPAAQAIGIVEQIGAVMAVPLLGTEGIRGALVITRSADDADFGAVDVEMAAAFANNAAVALELADARERSYQLELVADRTRLAGDLHDHVIQQLFAAALRIELANDELENQELVDATASVRDVITQLRETISGLRGTPVSPRAAIRRRIDRVVDESAVLLPCRPLVHVDGPIEAACAGQLGDDVVAVLREALSNTGRHAGADDVSVSVTAESGSVRVVVRDDGVGVGSPTRRSGLDSLARRAERNNGTFDVAPAGSGRRAGTVLIWTGRAA